ncbi:MAG: LptF/LptG family permease, partial [Geminicoccales bacterium]
MKLYARYLLWQLTLPALLATLAFSGAVWLSQSLRFVDLIVNKGLPITTFLYLTLLLFPSLLLVILPFALFCAVLFV